jgi:DNA-binding MarR family transcriptional regulator
MIGTPFQRRAAWPANDLLTEAPKVTKYSPDAKPEHLLPLHQKIGRIVHGLTRSSFESVSSDPQALASMTELLEVPEEAVSGAIRAWRERSKYLPGELFSDPAWGMLLELLQAEIQQRRVSLPRLCKVSAVSDNSAVRWLKALENRDLVVRRADTKDDGSEFIELAPKASAALRRYFHDAVTAADFEGAP